MRLKVNDTEEFNLTLDLNVDYENERITVLVAFWNKKQHQTMHWVYDAGQFDLALARYCQIEKTYFSSR